MTLRRVVIQLWGFIVKSFLLRYRSPVLTLLEIVLPCLFTILLSIVYWTTESTTIPATSNDGVAFNASALLWHYICQPPDATVKIRLGNLSLNTMTGPTGNKAECDFSAGEFTCASYIGNGRDVCMTTANYNTFFSGVMYAVYYGTGSMAVDDLEYYLIMSAYLTEESNRLDPTFFGRGGQASFSHFGNLLVASDDTDLAEEFITYAKSLSNIVGEIIHPTIFSSYEEAEDYATSHDNTVWAVLYLPHSSLTKKDISDPPEFTIGMNYSATPATYYESNRKKALFRDDDASDGYPLYRASGFLPLQGFVQNFYLQRYINNASMTPVGPAAYASPMPGGGVGYFLTQTGGPALIPFPTPERYNNAFLTQWAYYMPLIAMMAALFPVARLTGLIVEEKSKGIREAMLIMGLYRECNFGGWFITSLVINLVASLLAAMILKIGFLKVVDYGVLLCVYFTYMQQNTALAMALSTIFSNPRIAVWIAAFLVFVCGIPYYTFPDGMGNIEKIFCCLVPCIGYSESIGMMIEYASFHRHYGWHEARVGGFNTAIAVGMMWASWGIFILLTIYLDRVAPAAVGVRENPLFFLKPLIRCFHTPKQETVYMSGKVHHSHTVEPTTEKDNNVEEGVLDENVDVNERLLCIKHDQNADWIEHYQVPISPGDPSNAVVVSKLSKKYFAGGVLGFLYTFFTGTFRKGDQVIALDDVTFAMKRGEISVLLGPNGAGKSTIMGITTGLIRPSGGKVYIRNLDTAWDMSKCRQNIGYCPQQDIVWDTLTVIEHLRFYARLKDSKTFLVNETAENALRLAGLEEKRNCKAKDLSGGQKRRLCVAIALVGNSSVLFLDEPTAGMDMLGRKVIYESLQKARENRSVLISTHLLDEADRIGDRILMVNQGNIVAEGSSLFLKSKVDTGYTLTCILESGMTPDEENATVEKLTAFVKDASSPPVERSSEGSSSKENNNMLRGMERRGREVSYQFALDVIFVNDGQFLSSIQEKKESLGLRTVSLSLTSLEDVFLSLTGSASVKDAVEEVNELQAHDGSGNRINNDTLEEMFHNDTNIFFVFLRHFRALFLKRVHYAKRDFKLLIFQVIIPVAFLLLALLINLVQGKRQPSLLLDMSMYEDAISQVPLTSGNVFPIAYNAFKVGSTTPGEAFGRGYEAMWVNAPANTINGSQVLTSALLPNLMDHDVERYIGISPSNLLIISSNPISGPTIMHNMTYPHAAPQAMNALWNLASYQIYGPGNPIPIARNRPMYFGQFEKDLYDSSKQVLVGIFAILPFLFIPCNQIAYIVREKESGARHMQWLTGASVVAYWLSSFVFDLACYVVTIILSYIVFIIFNRTEFTSRLTLGPSLVLFLAYGVNSIPVAYLLSFLFQSPFAAQTAVLLINFIGGFLWPTIEEMLKDTALNVVKGLTAVLRVIPAVDFGEGMYVLSGNELAMMMMPDLDYSNLYILLKFAYNERTGKYAFTGGVGTGLIYMFCVGAACTIVLIILEYCRLQRLGTLFSSCQCCCGKSEQEVAVNEESDNDKESKGRAANALAYATVKQEEERVCADATGPTGDCIALQHLRKHYLGASDVALKDLTLGVHQGEVLALLGLNGAGKTTAVSILAGNVVRSGGEAFVNHVPVGSQASRSFVGYCPQHDPLIDRLSPSEHLYLYARIRGMRERYIKEEVQMLLTELGLQQFSSQPAISLSGGNKRRLTLAIALVGRTTSILLDEPTAGMDALARSQTCAMVKRLTRDKSVILTTHLLDEVDALSDRVAFLSRGSLKSIGTVTELKGLYSKENDFSLQIVFDSESDFIHSDEKDTIVDRLIDFISTKLREADDSTQEETVCVLREVHAYSVSLFVRGPISIISQALTGIRAGEVEDIPPVAFVSVNQSTIEEILLEE